MTWNESKKDTNGWAYESEVAKEFIKAMVSLAYEFHIRNLKPEVYESFFSQTTDKIKNLLTHEEELKRNL